MENKTLENAGQKIIQTTLVAVIDIGATAIRMEIAEVDDEGNIRIVDSLRKGVSLGKDTFTKGHIEQSTIHESSNILRGFMRVLREYGITDKQNIRAIATSSVREADNRDTFLDRIYMATGINVRAIDEAEESRLTYMAIHNLMESEPEMKSGNVLILDVGGGSTEILVMEDGHVTYSDSYRIGSLRMRETLETQRATAERVRTILGQHISRVVEQILRSLPVPNISVLVAMSGNARFAADHLVENWTEVNSARVNYKEFNAFVEKLLPLPVQKIVSKYHITYEEAETVGPALLVDTTLARALKIDHLLIPKTSLRHGLLREMCAHGYWTEAFAEEVLYAAKSLAEKYDVDMEHSLHVARLCMMIFDEIKPEHQLSGRQRVLLEVAAYLHDIGCFVSSRGHHKHSMYLILNSDLFGLTRKDLQIIALVARYHRRALPKPTHQQYMALPRDDRMTVSKMAAILRVADALDRNHLQRVRDISFVHDPDRFIINVDNVEDLTMERMAIKEKGKLFEEVYGIPVVLQEDHTHSGDSFHG